MKETEYYKRLLNRKQRDIKKLEDQIEQKHHQVEGLWKKLEAAKQRKGIKSKELKGEQIGEQNAQMNKRKGSNPLFIQQRRIPTTLDFRTNSLKSEYTSNFSSKINLIVC